MARRKHTDFCKGISPRGVFSFPKLQTPDTKFSEYGEYSVGVILEGETAERLKEQILEAYEQEYRHECEEHGKTLKRYENLPFGPTLDRDKQEVPGQTTFRFKRKAGGVYGRKHKKAGQEWSASFPIYDAEGTGKVKEEIWGGSEGRVSFVIVPWYTPSLGFGVRLQIEAVKILSLTSEGGERDQSVYGFESEDGYVAKTTSPAPEEAPSELADEEEASIGCDF